MPSTTQNFDNHRRFFPLYHFIALPIVVANVIVAVAELVQHPTLRDS